MFVLYKKVKKYKISQKIMRRFYSTSSNTKKNQSKVLGNLKIKFENKKLKMLNRFRNDVSRILIFFVYFLNGHLNNASIELIH